MVCIVVTNNLLAVTKEGSTKTGHWVFLLSLYPIDPVAYPGILLGGGSTNSAEGRENGDLGAVAPYSWVLETLIMWYFGGGFEPPNHPPSVCH
jgi:hypothetical protein